MAAFCFKTGSRHKQRKCNDYSIDLDVVDSLDYSSIFLHLATMHTLWKESMSNIYGGPASGLKITHFPNIGQIRKCDELSAESREISGNASSMPIKPLYSLA